MPPPRRPSAWDVSFPEEAAAELEALHISQAKNSSGASPSPKKRKAGDERDDTPQRFTKRVPKLNVAYYKPPRSVIFETAGYRAPGEDPEPDDNLEQAKPVRVLSNFCIFDPFAQNEFMTLEALEIESGRQLAAVGVALLAEEDDEDYGQEDGANPGDDTGEGDHVRLNNIELCGFDYFTVNAPLYIKSQFAYYELRGPSRRYKPYFEAFYAPRRVARAVLMRASANNQENLKGFRAQHREYSDEDLADAIPYIQDVAQEADGELQNSPLIKELLRKTLSKDDGPRRRTRPRDRIQPPVPRQAFLGNPDLALLKSENQSATHVTPFIAGLAKDYFEENLEVVGAQPILSKKAEIDQQKASALRFLKDCIKRVSSPNNNVTFSGERGRYGRFIEEVTIGNELYKSGDFVCIRRGVYCGVPAPDMVAICDVPSDAILADYFWFARIMWLNMDTRKVHVQWLEHGSQILLREMAHPQELFLNLLCEEQRIDYIAGKLSVVYEMDPPRKANQYFIRSVYNAQDVSFTSLNVEEMNKVVANSPPDNCLPCSHKEAYNSNGEWSILEENSIDHGMRATAGVGYQGQKYHFHEFFAYVNPTGGPAHIGYLENIQEDRRGRGLPKITFHKVGRVSKNLKGVELGDVLDAYPERHLFLTNEKSSITVDQLVRPLHVFAWNFFRDLAEFKRWIEYSPDHFYCSYRLPSLTAEPRADSWVRRVEVLATTLKICEFCVPDLYRSEVREHEFQEKQNNQDYDCLDLFGGTGAFSQATAEGSRGCLRPTHLIEITPSAARTAQKNSNMVTYCQDANVVLRYFIKSEANHDVEPPLQLWDNKTPLPPPIKPGKMRAIFAGLPCQSHSGLNMYRKAEDHKSNLILTALSYVDFFRPDFFFLENVPGFLKYNLLAEQAGRYRVEGGIEMGGLKLVLRALLDLKYQVHFCLLQAGNYGAPQNRVRFFLIAARHGLPLPDIPQPTHDFEVVNQLKMTLPYNHRPQVWKVRTTRGTMPHPSVSIEDAIGDLPQFDWKHPNPKGANPSLRQLQNQRAQKGIPAYGCDRDKTHCGYEGMVEYEHEPRTSFQMQARERPTENIQHFTRCLLPKTVERVVTIPLEPGADFRRLPENLAEWQFYSPVSAVGRNRYRGTLYGRLDKRGYFPTTVTNMHPTAKQSKVLHPDCLRMVTVRELARSQGFPDWFVFVSINNNVVTLHRQIGNAVPWQVSRALGRSLRNALFKKWKTEKLANAVAAGDEQMVG
ncbi:S-adenosyl-L-methionine-dependent methyltransferase [Mycena epipterygia]|nr:S-adenosyl-L-methionine-dependent methyltransferase [Mycena epipterygia]